MSSRWSRPAAWALSALLLTTGTLHFVVPGPYESIVPHWLGSAAFWVAVSGLAELACAAAIAVHPTRRTGALAAAVLFVVVFPANVQMALDSGGGGSELLRNPVIAWGRLPLQVPLVLWALYVARSVAPAPADARLCT